MNDFNSCIYKVSSKDEDNNDFYIGSSTNWKVRQKFHKFHCKNNFNRPLYQWINKNGGYENFNFEPIAWLPSKNVNDVREVEEMYFLTLKPTINVFHPKRSRKQYYIDNKEQMNEKAKRYYDKHRNKLLMRAGMKLMCPICGTWGTAGHLGRHQKTKKCQILGKKLLENK